MDLIDFLEERIADDERAAVSYVMAGNKRFPNTLAHTIEGTTIDGRSVTDAEFTAYLAEHGERRVDARAMAECEAKRGLIRLFAGTSHEGRSLAAPGMAVCRQLATIYADHPDFVDEWRVTPA